MWHDNKQGYHAIKIKKHGINCRIGTINTHNNVITHCEANFE